VPTLWIKICGLRTLEAIDAAVGAGADAVGFVFHDTSPRNVALDDARALQRAVPAGVERVAVFLHPSQALLDSVLAAIGPDWVQTDASDLVALRLPTGQRVLPVLRSGAALAGPWPPRCLFESSSSGSGERADWIAAARVARTSRLVLAGGLDPSNVGDAVRAVRPFGVDVSSGVESSRGVKDAARIREFIRSARAAEQALVAEENR